MIKISSLFIVVFIPSELPAFCPTFDWTENALIGILNPPNSLLTNYELIHKSQNKRIYVGKVQIILKKIFLRFPTFGHLMTLWKDYLLSKVCIYSTGAYLHVFSQR